MPLIFGVCCLVVAAVHIVPAARAAAGEFFNGLLIQKPRILLADEPVASLDPATAHSVLTLLHEICKKDHLTAIVSLHQVELARSFADRIIGLRQGAVVFEGRAEQLSPDVVRNLYAKQSNASNTSASTDSPRTLQSSQTKELLPC